MMDVNPGALSSVCNNLIYINFSILYIHSAPIAISLTIDISAVFFYNFL